MIIAVLLCLMFTVHTVCNLS